MNSESADEAFTLVELLTVLVIIGILAAVAIPSLLNQRFSAMIGTAESDVRNAAVAVEHYYTINTQYPADDAEFQVLVANGDVQVSSNVTLAYSTVGPNAYVITADHAGTGLGSDAEWDSSSGGLQ